MANGTMTQGGSISTFTPSDTPKETVVVTATVKDLNGVPTLITPAWMKTQTQLRIVKR